MSLPVTGQQNWGVPLNDFINNAVLAVANQALTSINTHTSAADPHGDRAYAAGLVQPLTTGVNQANGFVKLDTFGKIATGMLPNGSGLSNYYDVKSNYGALGNGSSDDSAKLQAALNDCAAAGGGEVWVADGTYALGSQLVIGAGTWLHLSPGATIKRIIPVAGSAPSVMISNVSFASGSAVPAAGNILISGGKWDAVGSGLTSSCTPILLVRAAFATITQTFFNGVAANPLIELNGSQYITVRDCVFGGAALTSSGGIVPAVRLNSTSTSTTPAGMAPSVYNNATCANILVEACTQVATGAQPSTNRLLAADLYAGVSHNIVTVTACSTAGSPYDAYPPVSFGHVTQGLSFGNLWDVAAGNPTLDLTTTGNVFLGPSAVGGNPATVYIAGQLTYATGFPGNVAGETWHTMTLKNSFTSGPDALGNNYNPAYKLQPDGSVVLRGTVTTPGGGATTTDVVFATLPAAYACTFTHPCAATIANSSGGEVGSVYLDNAGNLYLHGGFGQNINVFLDGTTLQRV